MDGLNLTDLLQVGFHGTALAFLILGYRLLKHALDDPPPDDPKSEKLSMILRNIRFFMGASLVFLLVGVGAQIFLNEGERQVEVHLSPTTGFPQGIDGPNIRVSDRKVIFEDGRGLLVVKGRDSIRVVIDHIVARLHQLELEIRAHESVLAGELEGGGFDEDAG